MSSVRLTLEAFTGRAIEQVIEDACNVARRCHAWVKINVNGIEVLISPNDEARWLLVNYHEARKRGASFVSANVIPDPRRHGANDG